MALGAPLVYADQAYSIHRKQDARGFSHDVCAVLLIANITRCFFWLGERFEFALLLQSMLMIAAQLGLLYLCIRYRPVGRWSKSISSDGARVVFDGAAEEEQQQGQGETSMERDLMDLNEAETREAEEQEEEEGYANKQPLLVTLGAMFRGGNGGSTSYGRVSSTDHSSYNTSSGLPAPNTAATTTTPTSRVKSILSQLIPSTSSRPLNFWQWSDYNSYLVFLFLYILLLLILYIPLSTSSTFISLLGYIALGLESTLPIPQLIANYRRKSLAGFRSSVLFGWLGGDSFKLLYFVLKGSPAQFTSCAVFQLSVDLAILGQSRLYRDKTQEEEEAMRSKAEGRNSRREGGRAGEIEEDDEDELPRRSARGAGDARGKGGMAGGPKGKMAGKRKDVDEEDELLQGPQHVISIEADDDDDEGDISNGRRK
ncbi:pq loop repeat protein [Pseudozyma hubeiensis SY62]|uniref:Pq loop repeat protein n=1 Tax=Pseudozyma hubeiensis (strain SY62) TaxID=1305764 RepID=R9P0Q8_PSEHS|nr:pq loop repeat protein [Pseudozyma hubeiensis SY62]GAC94652.1 pq loop repeat protein [Pseudozyma hubeiensis SY62]